MSKDQNELDTAMFRTQMDAIKQVLDSFGKELRAILDPVVNIHKQIADSFAPYVKWLHDLEEYGWDEEYTTIVERCGKLGWAFSMNMDMGAPRKLVGLSDKQIDRAFYAFFTENKGAMLKRLFSRLQEKCYCTNPKRLEEAIASFRARRYNATAVLLFSIIDYLILEVAEVDKAPFPTKLEKYANNIMKEKNMVMYHCVFFSAFCHLRTMFLEQKYKNTPETKMLNRHGILHGTSSHDVSRMECIQLFNTLDALVHTIKVIEMRKQWREKALTEGTSTK